MSRTQPGQEPLRDRIAALRLAIRWTYESSRLLTVSIGLLAVVGGLLTLVEPYLFKLVIDYLTDAPGAAGIGLGIAGILAVYGAARVLQSVMWDMQRLVKRAHSVRIERLAAERTMAKVASLDAVYFEDPEYYNTLSRANENLNRLLDLAWEFSFFLSQVVSVAVIIAALASLDWRIVALILLSAVPGIFLALRATRTVWSAFVESSPISRHANYYKELLTEEAAAVKELRVFRLQGHFIARFRSLFGDFIATQDRAVRSELAWYVAIGLLEAAFAIGAAWLVVQAYLAGGITLGSLTFLWALLFQFAGNVRYMVRSISDMNENATFLTSVVKLMSFEPRITSPPGAAQFPRRLREGIELREVSFAYPGSKRPALDRVSLVIRPGESVALVGENGSGKTTLIKLLTRMYDVTSGQILIDGRDIREYDLDSLHSCIGVIFQDFMRYEAQVRENVGYGRISRHGDEAGVRRAARDAGADAFVSRLRDGYATHVGKRLREEGVDLSVGQWQKVALARAFFRGAPIVILDEPTAAVDANAEYQLFRRFRRLTKGRTTVLISHRFSTVRMADRIVVLRRGRVAEEGSHAGLIARGGTYARLFRMQAEGYRE